MRIALINPNTTAAMTELMAEAGRGVVAADVEVNGVTVARGPTAIDGYVDEAYAAAAVADWAREHRDEDGYVIACVSDTGLYSARELLQAPVVGIGEAAYLCALTLGRSFSVLTTLRRGIGPIRDRIDAYGLTARCASVRATGVDVLHVAESEEGIAALLREGRVSIAEDGAEVLVLGCGGMTALRATLEHELAVPVVDGVTAAVVLVEGLVRCGLRTSKHSSFAFPEPTEYLGMPSPGVAIAAGTGQ